MIAILAGHPDPKDWVELIPQAAETLEHVSLVGDRFFASYLKDATTQVKVFDLFGQFKREVKLPGLGTAEGFGGHRKDKETFYSFKSYINPPTVYRYDIASGESTLFKAPKLAYNPDDYESEQVFYTSKDGTRIPMILSHKKGLKRDGNNPTLLYGYGGFNIPLTPDFKPSRIAWLEMGGVLAVPNLRGGGEYGEEWHQAGTKLRKQNVFDDFIAAAEWLIREKVTSTPKLAIEGRSQRRPARRRGHDPAARPLRRGPAGGGRDGHAPVPQVHDRLGVGRRLRLVRRRRAVRGDPEVFALA